MHTLPEYLNIAWKWLLSFSRSEWTFDDYPLRVRRNGADDPSIAWIAHFLNWPGPIGLGPTPEAAIQNFRLRFDELQQYRQSVGEPLPRPGTSEVPKLASDTRVNANPALLEAFMQKVLGFRPDDPVFISDDSSLEDFGDEQEVERLHGLIRSNFGVDASHLEGGNIASVLEYIANHSANSTAESDARTSAARGSL